MEVTYTSQSAHEGKLVLIYGEAGAGKTRALGDLDDLMIISAEGGMLSLADKEIPVLEVRTMEDVEAALAAAQTWTDYTNVGVDSITEITQIVLHHKINMFKDPRAAWGEMQEYIRHFIRTLRDIPGKNTVLTAQIGEGKTWDGMPTYTPVLAGNKMTQEAPFYPDEVLALRLYRKQDGGVDRWLQTYNDGFYLCKDRSNQLDPFEPLHLPTIFAKLRGADVARTGEQLEVPFTKTPEEPHE